MASPPKIRVSGDYHPILGGVAAPYPNSWKLQSHNHTIGHKTNLSPSSPSHIFGYLSHCITLYCHYIVIILPLYYHSYTIITVKKHNGCKLPDPSHPPLGLPNKRSAAVKASCLACLGHWFQVPKKEGVWHWVYWVYDDYDDEYCLHACIHITLYIYYIYNMLLIFWVGHTGVHKWCTNRIPASSWSTSI